MEARVGLNSSTGIQALCLILMQNFNFFYIFVSIFRCHSLFQEGTTAGSLALGSCNSRSCIHGHVFLRLIPFGLLKYTNQPDLLEKKRFC